MLHEWLSKGTVEADIGDASCEQTAGFCASWLWLRDWFKRNGIWLHTLLFQVLLSKLPESSVPAISQKSAVKGCLSQDTTEKALLSTVQDNGSIV